MVALAAGLLSISAPLAVGLSQHLRSEKDREARGYELDQKLKLEYVKLLVSSDTTEKDRIVVLSFLSEAAYSGDLRKLLENELSSAREAFDRIKSTVEYLESAVDSNNRNLAQLKEQNSQTLDEIQALQRYQDYIEEMETELARLKKQLSPISDRPRPVDATGSQTIPDTSRREGDTSAGHERPIRSNPVIEKAVIDTELEGLAGSRLPDPSRDWHRNQTGLPFRPGDIITISGDNFGEDVGYVVPCVESRGICGSPLEVRSWSDSLIRAIYKSQNLPAWAAELAVVTDDQRSSNVKMIESSGFY